jgi:hypothetical protein
MHFMVKLQQRHFHGTAGTASAHTFQGILDNKVALLDIAYRAGGIATKLAQFGLLTPFFYLI